MLVSYVMGIKRMSSLTNMQCSEPSFNQDHINWRVCNLAYSCSLLLQSMQYK